MKWLSSKPYIAVELALMMLVLPYAIYEFHLIRYMIPILWGVAMYCAIVHRVTTGETLRQAWHWGEINRASLAPLLRRFAICAIFLTVATLVLLPERLFGFVLEKPAFWAVVMLLYPLISVLPQEVIFRLFFFERYKHIFKTQEMMILASGLAFGLAHIIFQNWVAPLLCAVGGIIFAMTYARRKSLALVSLEHALYGDFIFTIGLGLYFYHGSVKAIADVAQ